MFRPVIDIRGLCSKAPRSLIWVAVTGAVGASTSLLLASCNSASAPNPVTTDWKKGTVEVKRGSIDGTVVADGVIRPIKEIKVIPESSGMIEKLYVKQDDDVKAGQLLVKMDDGDIRGQVEASQGTFLMAQDNYLKVVHGNRPQEIAVANYNEKRAEDIVRQAEHNVLRLKKQVESMEQQQIRDDTFADRQAYLKERGAVSEQDRLNAEVQANITHANLDSERRELAQAEATLAQNKAEQASAHEQFMMSKIGSREEDISSAKHAMIQAKGNLDSLKDKLKDTEIRAPFDGVITQKYADEGAVVTVSSDAKNSAILALAGKLEMVAKVPEGNISRIRQGQEAQIVSNAYPDYAFHGYVTMVAPEAAVVDGATSFEVHCSLDSGQIHRLATVSTDSKPQGIGSIAAVFGAKKTNGGAAAWNPSEMSKRPRLLSGMSVSANFAVGKLTDVLLVPTNCILSRSGKSGVLLAQPDGTPRFQEISVGPSQGSSTAVMSGLHAGDLIFTGAGETRISLW